MIFTHFWTSACYLGHIYIAVPIFISKVNVVVSLWCVISSHPDNETLLTTCLHVLYSISQLMRANVLMILGLFYIVHVLVKAHSYLLCGNVTILQIGVLSTANNHNYLRVWIFCCYSNWHIPEEGGDSSLVRCRADSTCIPVFVTLSNSAVRSNQWSDCRIHPAWR